MKIIEIVICFILMCVSFLFGAFLIWKIADEALKTQDKQTVRVTAYYNVLNQWLKNIHEGKDISEYFVRNGYRTIAIYGYAELGMRLEEEMRCCKEITVKYIIDKNAQNVASKLDVYQPCKELPEVDVIVITPIHVYATIDEMLKRMVTYDVVTLEDVIYDV